MTAPQVLRVGIIGAGRVSHVHAAGFADLQSARVVAVADPRPEAASTLAKRFGAEVESDHMALLARPDVDAVDILVPHDLHYPIALAALQAGKHVFMDKPLALTVAQGQELVAAARSAKRALMLCHNLLFHDAVRAGGSVVASGVLGRITTADSWSTGWLDLMPWDFRLSRERTGGGAWFDNGPHLLYVLERWLGPVSDLTALAGRGESRIGGEDSCVAVIRHQGGAVATARISYAERRPGHQQPWPAGWTLGFEVHGTNGFMRCEVVPNPAVTIYDGNGQPRREAVPATFDSAFSAAIAEFVAAALEGRDPSVTGEDSLRILGLVERAYQP